MTNRERKEGGRQKGRDLWQRELNEQRQGYDIAWCVCTGPWEPETSAAASLTERRGSTSSAEDTVWGWQVAQHLEQVH